MSSLTVLSRAPELHTTYRSRSVVRPCCSGEAGTASPVLERREALAAALLAPLLLPTNASAGALQDLFSSTQEDNQPIYFPRKRLNQSFAVLLLRSVYDAADAMDFVAMDEYQKQFWKLRSNEYEPYIQRLKPLPIRQLCTIRHPERRAAASQAKLSDAIMAMQEYCEDCPDQQRTVARCADLSDAVLPVTLQQQAGDRIYAGLQSGFRGETFDAPAPYEAEAPLEALAECVQRLLNVFVDNGFASKADVLQVEPHRNDHSVHWHGAGASGGSFTVQLERPSNLWGLGQFNLHSQDVIYPAFDALTVAAFLRASGCQSEHTIRKEPTKVLEEWTVHA